MIYLITAVPSESSCSGSESYLEFDGRDLYFPLARISLILVHIPFSSMLEASSAHTEGASIHVLLGLILICLITISLLKTEANLFTGLFLLAVVMSIWYTSSHVLLICGGF